MEKESHDPKILKEAAEYAAIHVLPKAGTPEFDTYLEMAKKDIEDKKISKEAVDHLFWEISYQWFSNLSEEERQTLLARAGLMVVPTKAGLRVVAIRDIAPQNTTV